MATGTTLREIKYKDIPNNFSFHPVTKKLNVLKDADAVKQSVKNIVMTNFYERPYRPNFGANLISQLFENMDPLTSVAIDQNIRRALSNHEPRARVIELRVNPDYDRNQLNITVTFVVVNLLEPITVDILIERVR